MDPTEALQREWDRQQVWPQRRWQARLLPLGKRLETPWAPREAGMEHVTFEPTAAFCTQLDGDQFEHLRCSSTTSEAALSASWRGC